MQACTVTSSSCRGMVPVIQHTEHCLPGSLLRLPSPQPPPAPRDWVRPCPVVPPAGSPWSEMVAPESPTKQFLELPDTEFIFVTENFLPIAPQLRWCYEERCASLPLRMLLTLRMLLLWRLHAAGMLPGQAAWTASLTRAAAGPCWCGAGSCWTHCVSSRRSLYPAPPAGRWVGCRAAAACMAPCNHAAARTHAVCPARKPQRQQQHALEFCCSCSHFPSPRHGTPLNSCCRRRARCWWVGRLRRAVSGLQSHSPAPADIQQWLCPAECLPWLLPVSACVHPPRHCSHLSSQASSAAPPSCTVQRTPAKQFFPRGLYRPLKAALLEYGARELGCLGLSPIHLRCGRGQGQC